MKKKKSWREKALEWWNALSERDKQAFAAKQFPHKTFREVAMFDGAIEDIWRNEIKPMK